jgi:hypothetical protein
MGSAGTSQVGRLSGGCLCGAVRFTSVPREHAFGACHCSMCRRWTAGPFLTVDCDDTVVIEDAANLGVYRSSDWAERCFCTKCGTPLFYRLVGRNHYAVSAEAFDDPKDFAFTSQIFIEEKPAYYEFANATKNMTGAEVFAAFAASQGDGR